MIIITGGFPYSGKTEFSLELVELFKKEKKLYLHIDPKRYLEELKEDILKEDESYWNISAWEVAYENTLNFIKKMPDKAICIFDTAASKISKMQPLCEYAKENGHKLIYVLIHAELDDRLKRINDKDKLVRLENNYAANLRVAIPKLKEMSNKFILIKNIDGEDGLKEIKNGVNKVINFIDI